MRCERTDPRSLTVGLTPSQLLPLTKSLFFAVNGAGQRFLLTLDAKARVTVRAVHSSSGDAPPAARPVWASLEGPPHALFSAPAVRLLATDAAALLRVAEGDTVRTHRSDPTRS